MDRGAFAIELTTKTKSFGGSTSMTPSNDDIIWQTKDSYCGNSITVGSETDGETLKVGVIADNGSRYWSGVIYSIAVFNRTLNTEEIEWVKENMV